MGSERIPEHSHGILRAPLDPAGVSGILWASWGCPRFPTDSRQLAGIPKAPRGCLCLFNDFPVLIKNLNDAQGIAQNLSGIPRTLDSSGFGRGWDFPGMRVSARALQIPQAFDWFFQDSKRVPRDFSGL